MSKSTGLNGLHKTTESVPAAILNGSPVRKAGYVNYREVGVMLPGKLSNSRAIDARHGVVEEEDIRPPCFKFSQGDITINARDRLDALFVKIIHQNIPA